MNVERTSPLERRIFAGFVVVIENRAGSIRHWNSSHTGQSGQTLMKHDYGYFDGHDGADGDELDCYLGHNENARYIYIVHQMAPPDYRFFEEDKVFLGFDSEAAAREAYLAHRNDGERAYGGMTALRVEDFRAKLDRRQGSGKIRHEVAMVLFKIEHRGAKWLVTSEDGSKVLGTHDTKADAEKQLRAVEVAKANRHARIFIAGGSQKFDVERGADGRVRIGVWDRFCSWGEKLKDGRLSIFDDKTLGEMVANWKARGDKLAMCFNHQSAYVQQNGQPAPALAFYDALAIIYGGQIIGADVLPGSAAATTGTFEAASRGDGLYGYRCEVTELGNQLLPNFKYISPMFSDDGRDELGNEIGYVLYDVAATNTPFQAGCEITFDNQKGAREMAKLSKLSKFVKCEEGADDKAIRQAVLSKMEEEATKAMEEEGYSYEDGAAALEDMAKAYEDSQYEEEEGGNEAPHVTMRRMASKFRRMAKLAEIEGNGGPGQEPVGGQHPGGETVKEKPTFDAKDGDGDGDKSAKDAMQAFAQRLGVSLPPNATRAQMFQALEAAAVPASQLPNLVRAQVERALSEQNEKRIALETADKAKALIGSLDGYPEENKKALLAFASDPKTYEAAVAIAKPFMRAGAESQLFSRMTSGGAPVALSGAAARASSEPAVGRKIYENALGTFIVDDEAIAAKICEYADAKEGPIKMEIDAMLSESERNLPDARWIAADKLVRTKKHPELWEQTRRAGLQLF